MAHGSPRINVCHDCRQYIWVNRFSTDPICPDCGKKSEQTTKEKLIEHYRFSWVLYNWSFSFTSWEKIPPSNR